MKFLLIIALLALTVCGCSAGRAEVKATEPQTGQCRISLVDDKVSPEFSVRESSLVVPNPEDYAKAYFAMGCFWGSEALLASAPGVVATRVGFSGGTLPDPSYSAIGDHVETVEVLYDPSIITYPELLRHFWRHHNSRAKPIFRQYASAIFCVEKAQLEVAKKEREAWQARGEEEVLTAILPAGEFFPAAENHQKYYLQQDSALFAGLPQENRLNTLLAAKLNAVSGRAGDRAALERTLEELGVDNNGRQNLFARALWEK